MNNDYSSIYAIGLYISKFNHCNIPNTNKEFVFYDKNTVFIYVIADKDIKCGDEINIYYGDTCLESPNIYHSGIPPNKEPYEKPQISTPEEVFDICDKYINSINVS